MFSNEAQAVTKLSDVYPVGTFATISEMHDMTDKLRMLLVGVRRIRIERQASHCNSSFVY